MLVDHNNFHNALRFPVLTQQVKIMP